jgi:hypothetical protein
MNMEISYCNESGTCHIVCIGSRGEEAIEAIVRKIDSLFPGRTLSDVSVVPFEGGSNGYSLGVKFHSEYAPENCLSVDEPPPHLPVDEDGIGFLFSRIFVLGDPPSVLHASRGPGNSLLGLLERIKEIETDTSFTCVPESLEVVFLLDETGDVYRPAIKYTVECVTERPRFYEFCQAIPLLM